MEPPVPGHKADTSLGPTPPVSRAGLFLSHLRCEGQTSALGLDAPRPRLTWELTSDRHGARPTAWQVQVWSGSLLWDSGKQAGDGNRAPYGGPALVSRQRCSWRVRVWDENDEASDWSPEASWEMGLLETSDWEAVWVEPEQMPATREPGGSIGQVLAPEDSTGLDRREKLRPCQIVRRSFRLESPVRRGRLYATAHGIYQVTINGQRLDDRVFAPEATAYQSLLLYQTYDVTDLLQTGDNTVEFVLADGWWIGRIGLPGSSCQYGDRLGLLFQLEAEGTDGFCTVVASNRQCESATGPWDYADLFIGERYDARRPATGWKPVHQADFSLGNLAAQQGDPVRPLEVLPVVQVITTPRGDTVLDFGQVIAGRVRLTCHRPAGTVVQLDHSECLDAQGNWFTNIVGRNKDQRDFYVCGGQGEETWEPQFTYHGFRYVKVTGDVREGLEGRYKAVVLGTDLRTTGTFACSDSRVNQLFHNILWSQKANLFSIPTDCPQRERGGFTGDAQAFVQTAAFNQDVQTFFERWLRSLAYDQRPDGEVPSLVPYWQSYIEVFYPMQQSHGSAGWGDACIFVPWHLYQSSGDRTLLEANYPVMEKWMGFLEDHSDDWTTRFHFGDWLAPAKVMAGMNPFAIAAMTKAVVARCCAGLCAAKMAEIAGILGKQDDQGRYQALYGQIQTTFTAEFLGDDGRVKADFQGAYLLALAAGLVPEDDKPAVLDQLVESIRASGGRLDAGFVSIPHLMDVLTDNGLATEAFNLLFQTECPSWLYEVEKGATTIWESWGGIAPDGTVGAFSFNHYAFGCVGQWLYRNVAGIAPLEPGFRRVRIRPQMDPRLTWAEATYHSVRGPIRVRWERTGTQVRLQVDLPPGCEADIDAADVQRTVGSGRHTFE